MKQLLPVLVWSVKYACILFGVLFCYPLEKVIVELLLVDMLRDQHTVN